MASFPSATVDARRPTCHADPMQIIPPPDPIASEATRAAWKRYRNRQAPLPDLINAGPPLDRDRHWGKHLTAYQADGIFTLQAICLLLGFAMLFQILVQNWEIAAVLMAIVGCNLLAAHYARQAECPHLFARILCAIYFGVVRSIHTGRVLRREVRTPALIFFGFLIFFALRIRSPIGHDRPALIDWRRLDRSANWDYLRENNFFREPPAAAESP